MFYTWTDWVNDITSSPDNTQIKNAAEYENYVLKLYCNFYNEANDACGLAHDYKGAIMIEAGTSGSIDAVSDTSTAESNTYTLTNDQLDAWIAEGTSATALSSKSSSEVTKRTNTSVNDPFFQIFYCGGSRDFVYTCYKYQSIYKVGTGGDTDDMEDGNPRFDPDQGNLRVVHYDDSSTKVSYVATIDTISGAFSGLKEAALLVSAIVSLSYF